MGCPDVIYSIMCRCWAASAEQRASAADVEGLLGRVSEAQVAGLAAVTAFEGTQLTAGQWILMPSCITHMIEGSELGEVANAAYRSVVTGAGEADVAVAPSPYTMLTSSAQPRPLHVVSRQSQVQEEDEDEDVDGTHL